MKIVTLHDKTFKKFIGKNKISDAITKVAKEINKEYANDILPPILLSVLNGSFMFTSDVCKKLNFNHELSFIKVASYDGTASLGKVSEIIGLNTDIENRRVIIFEDIVDTGNTLETLIPMLLEKKPKSVEVATFLFKPEAYKKDIKVNYIGLSIDNIFVVGYGLDYNQLGRNLPRVYSLIE